MLGVWSLSNARAEGLGMGIRSQARFIFYPYCSFHSRLFLTKVYTTSKYTEIAVKKQTNGSAVSRRCSPIKLKTRLTEELILTYGKDFEHHDSIAPSEIIK